MLGVNKLFGEVFLRVVINWGEDNVVLWVLLFIFIYFYDFFLWVLFGSDVI